MQKVSQMLPGPYSSQHVPSTPSRTALRRGRRAMRLAAATLVAACWAALPADAPGQVRTSSRGGVTLLPAPGSPGTTPAFSGEIATPAWATANHPLFQSSYMGEDNRVIANTRYGPVTSSDFYLWLILRDVPVPYLVEAYQKARTVTEKERLAKTLRQEINDFVFTNFVLPERMGNQPCDAVSGLREQLRLLPAYHLTYILRLIKPDVCVQQADRVKYLQENRADFALPERFRVRYIRLLSSFNEPIEEQDRVEARIVDLRQQIAQGGISFAQAARQFSQAPSAAQGGEIPPFAPGTLFFFFEDALSGLDPGEVSAPFRGPDGSYYLVQLLERLPAQEATLDDPVQAARVDEGLWRKVLRAQYEYEGRRLFERRRSILLTSDWDDRRDDDIIGAAGDFGITKRQFRDVFPFVEGEDLRRRDALFGTYLRPILEREAMAQEVREAGCDNDPILQRARWIVANLTRRDAFVEQCESTIRLDDTTVRSFWRRNPELFTPMAMKRIFRITLSPTNVGPAPESLVGELARILTVTAQGQKPTALPPAVVTSPGSVIDAVLSGGGTGALSLFGDPLPEESTDGQAPLQLDLSPLETTGGLELPTSLPADELPVAPLSTDELATATQSLDLLSTDTIGTTESQLPVPSLSGKDRATTGGQVARALQSAIPRIMKSGPVKNATSGTVVLKENRGGQAPGPVGGGLPAPSFGSAPAGNTVTEEGTLSAGSTGQPGAAPAGGAIATGQGASASSSAAAPTTVEVAPGASVAGGVGPAASDAAGGTSPAPPPVPARTIVPAEQDASSAPPPPEPPAPRKLSEIEERGGLDLSDVGPYESIPNPLCPPIYESPVYGHTLSDFLPETPPAVPCPSAIPFNPDLRYPKISAREVTALFSSYVSPDFALRVEDLGYMYVQDRREIPKQVVGLEPGAFSYPAPVGPTAVSYFVSNAKQPVRPSFDQIKSRVYSTYRVLQVNECIDAALKDALKRAKIEYRFQGGATVSAETRNLTKGGTPSEERQLTKGGTR